MFLDISFGILISIFANQYFGIELNLFLIFICIIFALLPDLDFLWAFFSKEKSSIGHSHREILHHPLLFILIGLIIFIFGKVYALLFGIAIFWHFINDTIFLGFGVQWFWPFSKKYFSFFGSCGYRAPNKLKLPFKFFYAWKPEEIDSLEEKYGDPDWIKNIYLKFHLIAKAEYLFFILTLILLVFLLR